MSATPWPSPLRSRALWGNLACLLLLAALATALWQLQSGVWWPATPRSERWTAAGVTLLLYLGFCGLIFWRSRPRTQDDAPQSADGQPPWLVAYASQTGFAQQLAERTAASLRDSGLAVRLRSIAQVDAALLGSTRQALFIASTTGEGDPPDPALSFVRQVMGQEASLHRLRYAVLALGDREYDHFCAFGYQLDDWLRRHGAQALFDLVEVDNADQSALRHWQHHLGQIGGITDLPDWTPPSYEAWTLVERRELNPGSAGAGAFHLALTPPANTARRWSAGDIAEIGPRHPIGAASALLRELGIADDALVQTAQGQQPLAVLLAASHLPTATEIAGRSPQAIADELKPLPHREYSIASLPADGAVHLLLRRMLRADGTPGLGSGWLCDHAAVGGQIALRLRPNPNFHPPRPEQPMILIGNGTGIAGLRAHLKQRIADGAKRNWLLFGERNARCDFFYGQELRTWHEQGLLERLDLAFSRDQPTRIHVQHKLLEAADAVRAWIDQGAALYVCGSLSGMAPGVDAALRQIVGNAKIEELLATGRYRRDVY